MDHETFIATAYVVTALLLAALCIATWTNAKRVRKQLDRHTQP